MIAGGAYDIVTRGVLGARVAITPRHRPTPRPIDDRHKKARHLAGPS